MRQVEIGFKQLPITLVRFGPTIQVQIGFDSNFTSGTRPNLPDQQYNALVDTGALESCIDSSIADNLNLPVIDNRPISGVQGISNVNVYLAQIFIPALNYCINGAFSGVHLHAGGQVHSVLIGRTFLQHFEMHYDGTTGSVHLSMDK